ncbi:MAG: hypothetical protein L6R00_14915 [Phycisphaerae bacterium]|nr:hypothetical protein [Phycisphaerae bacterium]
MVRTEDGNLSAVAVEDRDFSTENAARIGGSPIDSQLHSGLYRATRYASQSYGGIRRKRSSPDGARSSDFQKQHFRMPWIKGKRLPWNSHISISRTDAGASVQECSRNPSKPYEPAAGQESPDLNRSVDVAIMFVLLTGYGRKASRT